MEQESLLPSVRSILNEEIPYGRQDFIHLCYEGMEEYVIRAMKSYGEKLLKVALQVAAEKGIADLKAAPYSEDDWYAVINKLSITDLINSPELKIK